MMKMPLRWLAACYEQRRQFVHHVGAVCQHPVSPDAFARTMDWLTTTLPLYLTDEREDILPVLRESPDVPDLDHVLGRLETSGHTLFGLVSDLGPRLRGLSGQHDLLTGPDGLIAGLRRFAVVERAHVALATAVVLPIARVRLDEAALARLSAGFESRR